jgi:hypothetical protein
VTPSINGRRPTAKEIAEERRREDEERQAALYPIAAVRDAVTYLRRRDFTITAELGRIRLDNRLVGTDVLLKIAARERRVERANMPAAVLEAQRRGGRPRKHRPS